MCYNVTLVAVECPTIGRYNKKYINYNTSSELIDLSGTRDGEI